MSISQGPCHDICINFHLVLNYNYTSDYTLIKCIINYIPYKNKKITTKRRKLNEIPNKLCKVDLWNKGRSKSFASCYLEI
jgi:hypothetical protein